MGHAGFLAMGRPNFTAFPCTGQVAQENGYVHDRRERCLLVAPGRGKAGQMDHYYQPDGSGNSEGE